MYGIHLLPESKKNASAANTGPAVATPASRDGGRTPPLAWARAFVAAGELGSFKAAAESLHLAPSTISHEIRKLEDWLGFALFVRRARSIALTTKGAQLLASVQPAFASLDAAFQNIQQNTAAPLRLGMLPYFAAELVLPKLHLVSQLLDARPISIVSDTHLSALLHPDVTQRVDAVVRYAKEPPAGYASITLTSLSMALARTTRAVDVPQRSVELSAGFSGWQTLRDSGFSLPPMVQPPVLVDNYLSAMRAVEQGVGLGVALLPLCRSWLNAGRIELLSDICAIEEQLLLVWREDSEETELLTVLANSMAHYFAQGEFVATAGTASDV